MDRQRFPIHVSMDELIKLIVEKEVFRCFYCDTFRSRGEDMWEDEGLEDYPWIGKCNDCHEKILDAREKHESLLKGK